MTWRNLTYLLWWIMKDDFHEANSLRNRFEHAQLVLWDFAANRSESSWSRIESYYFAAKRGKRRVISKMASSSGSQFNFTLPIEAFSGQNANDFWIVFVPNIFSFFSSWLLKASKAVVQKFFFIILQSFEINFLEIRVRSLYDDKM